MTRALHAQGSDQSIELALRRPLPVSSSTVWSLPRSSVSDADQVQSKNIDAASFMQQSSEEIPGLNDSAQAKGAHPDDIRDERGEAEGSSLAVNQSSVLAPVDSGFGAWSFLAAAFFIETIVWGFPNSFGVFLEAYLADSTYASQESAKSVLPLIGPLSSGIMYTSGVFIQPILARYPQWKKTTLVLGAMVCFASLFGASYSTNITTLVFLQGVLYAIGGSLLYAPCISYLPEWFVARRGFANGVIFSGTAVGGALLPVLLSQLLKNHSIAYTLRMLAISVGALFIPFLPFVRGRLPISRVVAPRRGRGIRDREDRDEGRDGAWKRDRVFWMVLGLNTVQSFAYFVPMVWLPTYATDLDLGPTKASVVLALLNGASCISRTLLGLLSDTFNPWLLAISTLTVTSLATFILWGVLSTSYAGLLAFGVVYGVFAGGWSSLWTGFLKGVVKDDHVLATAMISYMMCTRGIGNILSTPIATTLVNTSSKSASSAKLYTLSRSSAKLNSTSHHTFSTSPHSPSSLAPHALGERSLGAGYAVGEGKFQNMILYVGSCFAGAAVVAVVGWGLERWGGASRSRSDREGMEGRERNV